MKNQLFKERESQAVLEYTILFAIVVAALVSSLFLANGGNTLKSNFLDMTEAMAGDSLENSTIGGWD